MQKKPLAALEKTVIAAVGTTVIAGWLVGFACLSSGIARRLTSAASVVGHLVVNLNHGGSTNMHRCQEHRHDGEKNA
jgi:hypothetical protein